MFTIIREIMSGEGISIESIVQIFVLVFIVVCCNPVHESAHAWMADRLGDPTGRLSGRITMNPMRHLDPIGAIMLLLFGFGYAKPVPVNIRNFKKRKQYFAITAAAGPVSNLLLALLFTVLEAVFTVLFVKAGGENGLLEIAATFFRYAGFINVSLAVFNLIPIPPLDGSRLLTALLPDRIYYKIMQYERYSMLALFALLFLFDRIDVHPLTWLTTAVFGAIRWLVNLPFGLIFR